MSLLYNCRATSITALCYVCSGGTQITAKCTGAGADVCWGEITWPARKLGAETFGRDAAVQRWESATCVDNMWTGGEFGQSDNESKGIQVRDSLSGKNSCRYVVLQDNPARAFSVFVNGDLQGGAKQTGPSYLIANILKTPWPNCVEIGELLQYYMLNTVINFLFKNFIALWRRKRGHPISLQIF